MLHIISENSQFGGILDNYFSTEIRFDQKTIELYLVVPNAMAKVSIKQSTHDKHQMIN